MYGVELDLGLLHLDRHLHLVVGFGHGLQLADSVGGEASPLGSVMQHQALRSLVVHEVGWSSDPWVGELQILVKVVQAVEEICGGSSVRSVLHQTLPLL